MEQCTRTGLFRQSGTHHWLHRKRALLCHKGDREWVPEWALVLGTRWVLVWGKGWALVLAPVLAPVLALAQE